MMLKEIKDLLIEQKYIEVLDVAHWYEQYIAELEKTLKIQGEIIEELRKK